MSCKFFYIYKMLVLSDLRRFNEHEILFDFFIMGDLKLSPHLR